MWVAVPSCFRLLKQDVVLADALAWANTGKRIAAKMAMIAMTTSSSISVNALFRFILTSNSTLNCQDSTPVLAKTIRRNKHFVFSLKQYVHQQ
jgi:hypothetical protein